MPARTRSLGNCQDRAARTVPIGRINIFDPGDGTEGADNIQAWGAASCPADLDGNGTVGASDLLALLANWGPCP